MGQLLAPGDVVSSKYRITRELGRGGMGIVYEALNLATDGRVAIKVLNLAERDDAESVARFAREARAAGRLRSRFVARVLDHDSTPAGVPFLVMELLEGKSLGAIARERGTLSVGEATSLVVQACAGVAEAHRAGIVHRDLKPSNLFFDTGGGDLVRVLDFGVSKVTGTDDELTSSNAMVGTYSYMSPEQLRASRSVDARSDVWALGLILYRLLEGRLPYTGTAAEVGAAVLDPTPVRAIARSDVPPALVALVARAVDKDATRRFADAAELGRALAPFAEPTAMTSLALNELTGRASSSSAISIDGDDGTTSTFRAAPADEAPSTRATFVLPRKKSKRSWTGALLLLLAGTAIGAVVGYRIYLRPGDVTPTSEAPTPTPIASAPPSTTTEATATASLTTTTTTTATPPVPAAPSASTTTLPRRRVPPRPPSKQDENPARL